MDKNYYDKVNLGSGNNDRKLAGHLINGNTPLEQRRPAQVPSLTEDTGTQLDSNMVIAGYVPSLNI